MKDRYGNIYKVTETDNGTWTSSIIRDTGYSCVVVSEKALLNVDIVNVKSTLVAKYLGRTEKFPIMWC